MSAGVATPPVPADGPAVPVLPQVRSEIVDPADKEQVGWLCDLLTSGRADLYGQDEADLALLPTLTCTWMLRGQQLLVKAPGNNEKCSVSCAVDVGTGALLFRTDERRCAEQFCGTLSEGADRSTARGRVAVFLVDNAKSHKVGKTGIVRRGMDALEGRVVLTYQPAYSPDLQPAERIWRQWRPNVTHNHTRESLTELKQDSDAFLTRLAAKPATVLEAIGVDACQSYKLAA